jgi:hypothetical protein
VSQVGQQLAGQCGDHDPGGEVLGSADHNAAPAARRGRDLRAYGDCSRALP